MDKNEWLPIETAPKDGSFVLLYSAWNEAITTGLWQEAFSLPEAIGFKDRSINTTEGYWVQERYIDYDRDRYPYRPVHDVTHWMPLPEAPENPNG